jgi:hypothetical protein
MNGNTRILQQKSRCAVMRQCRTLDEGETLLRYLVPFCGVVLVAGSLVTGVNACPPSAKVLDAARRPNPPVAIRMRHSQFQALFDQAYRTRLPDVRMNDRSAIVPRKEWFTWP